MTIPLIRGHIFKSRLGTLLLYWFVLRYIALWKQMFANKKLVIFSVLLRQIILIVVLPWCQTFGNWTGSNMRMRETSKGLIHTERLFLLRLNIFSPTTFTSGGK